MRLIDVFSRLARSITVWDTSMFCLLMLAIMLVAFLIDPFVQQLKCLGDSCPLGRMLVEYLVLRIWRVALACLEGPAVLSLLQVRVLKHDTVHCSRIALCCVFKMLSSFLMLIRLASDPNCTFPCFETLAYVAYCDEL